VTNADGSGVTRLTHDSASDVEATWSPDGSKIAFASGTAGGSQIDVMNADGSGVVGLTSDLQGDAEPAWSPDGSKIAFSNGQLKVINADGTGATTLTSGWNPQWSPDGSSIAFHRVNHTNRALCSQSPCTQSFYVIKADGSGLLQLEHNLSYGGVTSDVGPSWSPDGSRVAFVSTPTSGGARELYVANVDGSGLIDLTQGSGAGFYPAWKPR
jgi:Tol biopolymer transport system component